jgi:hypothetical protein
MGDYVLTAEDLITGSLADDDVATGRYHTGIHRPSGRNSGGNTAAWSQEESSTAVITRGFGGGRRDDTDLPPDQYRTDDFSLSPDKGFRRLGRDPPQRRRHRRHHHQRTGGPPAQRRHRVGIPPIRQAPARLRPSSRVTAAHSAASDERAKAAAPVNGIRKLVLAHILGPSSAYELVRDRTSGRSG